jgi:hypothetical protein
MQVGGYDVVAEIRKELLNKFLAIGFCAGDFPVLKKSYTLPIPNVPANLQEFMVIGYEVSLAKEPKIDITPSLHIQLTVAGEAKFTVLGGIEFSLEAEFTIGCLPSFDQATRRLHIDFATATIDDVSLDNSLHLPANVIAKLNEIISLAMQDYLTTQMTSIEISPVLFSLDLPEMPPADKLTIGLGNFKIFDQSLVGVAINLLGYNGGVIGQVADFTGSGNNVGLGVSEAAMHRVYDFWWAHTTNPKSVSASGSHDFDASTIEDWVSDLTSWATGFLTGGIYIVDVNIDRVWADYSATVKFGKFSFDLKPGNVVALSGSITADLAAQVYVQVTTEQKVLWGACTVSSKTQVIEPFQISLNNLKVNIDEAAGEVYIDSLKQLTVKVTDLKLSIDLNWVVPEPILNYIVNWLVDQAVKNLPPIHLFPAMIEEKIPGTNATVDVTFNKLTIDEDEALVAAQVDTSGKETYAPYVGDNNTMDFHNVDCEWAKKISTRHRVYYCRPEDAIKDGYDGCVHCLHQYYTG